MRYIVVGLPLVRRVEASVFLDRKGQLCIGEVDNQIYLMALLQEWLLLCSHYILEGGATSGRVNVSLYAYTVKLGYAKQQRGSRDPILLDVLTSCSLPWGTLG
jgi:hypothetical protein